LNPAIDVIIPVYNEEASIGKVLDEIPMEIIRNVVVCNNGSTDHTADVAISRGAILLNQPLKGYGNACLKGMEYLNVLSCTADHQR